LQYLKTRFAASEIKADAPIEVTYRTTTFSGNTSNSVVIYKEADGCLRVLDSVYNNTETVPGASFYLIDAIPLSNPELILTDAPTPEMEKTVFGNEPSHDWCYTYAKAEIARQLGNWDEVVNLYKEAQKAKLSPALPVEYLPFIEAFARTGDIDSAVKFTERTIKAQPTLCPALNTLWNRVSGEVDISEAESLLQKECKP
jgi:tetratricopeptide (TPR) repeat protein